MNLIKVSWNSPHDGESRTFLMTEDQASEWWNKASEPVRTTARFEDAKLDARDQKFFKEYLPNSAFGNYATYVAGLDAQKE